MDWGVSQTNFEFVEVYKNTAWWKIANRNTKNGKPYHKENDKVSKGFSPLEVRDEKVIGRCWI